MSTRYGIAARPGILAIFLACGIFCFGAEPNPVLRIGITSSRDESSTVPRWNPLAQYLESQIPGSRFSIVPLAFEALENAVAKAEIDFVLCPSTAYISLQDHWGVTPLATYRYSPNPQLVTSLMGGAIVIRSDVRNIALVGDLAGKRLAAVDPQAMGGWISVWRELKAAGIDPFHDLKELRFVGTDAAVFETVMNGVVDAGVVPAGALERMESKGQLDGTAFRVLPTPNAFSATHDFALLHSTRLYPEKPFLRLPHVPENLARAVTIALLNMPEAGETAIATEAAGWTIPPNYQSVQECMKELQLGPYKDYGKVTLRSILDQHWDRVLLSLLVLVGILGGSTAWTWRLNRRLHRAGKAVADSEQRYRALFSGGSDAVFVHGIDADGLPGRFLEANDIACRRLGYSREELLRLRPMDIDAPDAIPVIPVMMRKLFAEKRAVWEGAHMTKDGRRIPVEISNQLFDFDGNRTIFASVRDISDRKRSEEEQSKLEEQLRQAQKLESIGRLAGGVAHDFNNLLTVISGYSDLLLDRSDLTGMPRSHIEQIRKAGERATSLTQQLLAFSRKQVVQLHPLKLNAVVIETEQMLRRVVGEDIEIVTILDEQAGQVMADQIQIQQVIMNLAVNARDAMPGNGKLIIETCNVDLDGGYVATHPEVNPGPYVLMTITDTGTGMDQETLKHIFEPFYTTKERGKGTGLGLSMVYGIVRQHQGWVWVYSEPGKGSTFKVYLPRIEVRASIHGEAMPSAAALAGAETILVVEDQQDVRILAMEVLKAYGYHVLGAAHGGEALALEAGHSGPIDLMLTDVIMPGMTGRELADQLIALRPNMKVLYMSGYTQNVIAHQGVLDPSVAYLPKPFTPQGLAAKVHEVLHPPTHPQ
jgi:two-component system, cell cycle sensor histidine kinase and response regulator CckA